MVHVIRNEHPQGIEDQSRSEGFPVIVNEDGVHRMTKKSDMNLKYLHMVKTDFFARSLYFKEERISEALISSVIGPAINFSAVAKMMLELGKEEKFKCVEKGCLHGMFDKLDAAISIILRDYDKSGKSASVHLSYVEYRVKNSYLSGLRRDIGRKLGELEICVAKDWKYTEGKSVRGYFIEAGAHRIAQSAVNSLKVEEHVVTLHHPGVRINQGKTKKTSSDCSNDCFLLGKNSNSYSDYISNELDASSLSNDSYVSNISPLGSGIDADNPRCTKYPRIITSTVLDGGLSPSSEHRTPHHHTDSDGTGTKEKEFEVQNSYEDFHSSQQSRDILTAEELSPPRVENSNIAGTLVTDTVRDISTKIDMSVTDGWPGQTTSCQVPEPASGIYPKQSEPFVPLVDPKQQSLHLDCLQLRETSHVPERESPQQPPPAEDTSPPTSDSVLGKMGQVTWRLASMQHLRDLPVRHQDLSNAGWFYDEDRDEFRCYCCPAARARDLWDSGDNPENLHRQISPGCPHLHSEMVIGQDEEDETMVKRCDAVRDDDDEVEVSSENKDDLSCRSETDLPVSLNQGIYLSVGKETSLLHCYAEIAARTSPVSEPGYGKQDVSEYTVDDVWSLESEVAHSPSDNSSGQRGETGDGNFKLESETCDLEEDGEKLPEAEGLSCSGTSQKEDTAYAFKGRHEPSHTVSRSNSYEEDCREETTGTYNLDVRGEEIVLGLHTRGTDVALESDDVSLPEQYLQTFLNPMQTEATPDSSTASPTLSHDESIVPEPDSSFGPGRETTRLPIPEQTDSEISNAYRSQSNGFPEELAFGNSSLSLRRAVTLSDARDSETPPCDLNSNDEEDQLEIHSPAPPPQDLTGGQPDITTIDNTSDPHTS